MIRLFYGALICFVPFFVLGQQSSHQGAPKYDPGEGKVILIMGQDLGAVGGLDAYSDGYVDHLGQIPAGVTTYTGFPGLGGLLAGDNWGAGDVHAQAYLEAPNFDNSVIAIGLHLVDQLGSIIVGSADPAIQELGEWIIATGRPVFLRIGYEFDGSWNHYDPEQFKKAWIYLVEYFDNLDVRNVAYVWQAHGGNTANIGRWYPGDEYVNWMGYSNFDEPNPGVNILAFAELHNKPVMIAEATPRVDLKTGDGAAIWANWYEPLFEKIHASDRIKALAYINADWDSQSMWTGQGWGDSRVQVNEVVKQNWQEEMGMDPWIIASDSLFDFLDYQQWQDSVVVTLDPVRARDLRVQVIWHSNQLIIREKNHALLDKITIWDVSGRLIYMSREQSREYMIPASDLPGNVMLILHTRVGDRLIYEKAILIR